jgi:glutathione synthase/RimK-type ligase-like ATP-grasp enzyme
MDTAADYLDGVIRRGWVLVTDGGSGQGRSALAAVRALAAWGYKVAVTVSGSHSLAAASRYCKRRVQVDPVTDASAYKQGILRETRSRSYLTVMPTSDAALLALGAPVKHLVDKTLLEERAHKAGLSMPPTQRFESVEALLDASSPFGYPVVIKPVVSRWPAVCVAEEDELRALADRYDTPVLVQPFLQDDMRAVAGVMYEGRLVAVSHQRYYRTWPVSCGTASAAETVAPDLDLEAKITKLLSGYDGIFQAQLAADNLLDLNPRPYGSMPLAERAGANLPGILCDLLHGVEYSPMFARLVYALSRDA